MGALRGIIVMLLAVAAACPSAHADSASGVAQGSSLLSPLPGSFGANPPTVITLVAGASALGEGVEQKVAVPLNPPPLPVQVNDFDEEAYLSPSGGSGASGSGAPVPGGFAGPAGSGGSKGEVPDAPASGSADAGRFRRSPNGLTSSSTEGAPPALGTEGRQGEAAALGGAPALPGGPQAGVPSLAFGLASALDGVALRAGVAVETLPVQSSRQDPRDVLGASGVQPGQPAFVAAGVLAGIPAGLGSGVAFTAGKVVPASGGRAPGSGPSIVAEALSSFPSPLLPDVAVASAALVIAGVALYHLVRKSALLKNGVRARISDHVLRNPGCTITDVAEAASVTHQTASYHLRLLERHGLALGVERGNKRLYFRNDGSFNSEERELVAVLRDAESSRVLEAVRASPGLSKNEAAQVLGMSRNTLNWHLQKLIQERLVVETRSQGRCFLECAADAAGRIGSVAERLASAEVPIHGIAGQVPFPVPAASAALLGPTAGGPSAGLRS